jgi:hypothetical protein
MADGFFRGKDGKRGSDDGKGGSHGYGMGENVHSGSGSKGRGKAVGTANVSGGGDAGSSTEKTHNTEFAKGGKTPMFGLQEAGSRNGDDRSPSTGKPDSSGPGEKFADGGKNKMFGFNPAVTATSGITSAR